MAAEIEVRVDMLALNGFPAFDAGSFDSALTSELSRLVSENAPPPGVWQVKSVQIDLRSGADSAAAGIQVARAIYDGMRGDPR